MSNEYKAAGKPVVFIEQNIDVPVDNNRLNRFWYSCQASGSPYCGYLPWTMTDSGYNVMNSYSLSFSDDTRSMVDSSLARPPKATISAVAQRVGNHYHFDIQVTNLSGVTLSTAANEARVFAMVYEVHAPDGTHLTNRIVRASVSTGITSLAHQASANFSLDTPDLSGVVWANLHPVVIVDYRPGGAGSGYYDMLQAAFEYLFEKIYLPLVMKN